MKVQVGGYPTGLDGHQVSSDTYNIIVHKSDKYIQIYTESTRTKPESNMRKKQLPVLNTFETRESKSVNNCHVSGAYAVKSVYTGFNFFHFQTDSHESPVLTLLCPPPLYLPLSFSLSLTHQHTQPFSSLPLSFSRVK